MAKITYDNKEIYTDGSTNSQYFRYQDANEIKSVVNANDTRLEHLYELLSQETTQTGTELTINNTFADNMKLDLKGNTEQYTTTGIQMLNFTNRTSSSNGITGVMENGKITLNGTATANSYIGFFTTESIVIPANTNYTISVNNSSKKGTSTDICSLRMRTSSSSDSSTEASFDVINSSHTFSKSSETTYTGITITTKQGYSYDNFVIYPQLQVGDTASSWEPYTGGIPSPNPSFPQEVKVVTGDNTIKIEGENLNYLQNLKWIVNSSGVVVTNNTFWDAIIDTRNHNSIYISGDFSLLSDSAIRVGLFTDYPALNSQGVRATITSNSAIDTTNCNYVLLCYTSTGTTHTIDEIRNSFMVSYGNTQVPYRPYVSTSYPVNLGSIELCKIGDYQDYIYKDLVTNKWYKYETITKMILTGDENWGIATNSSYNYNLFSLAKTGYMRTNEIVAMSNNFRGVVNKARYSFCLSSWQ